MLRRTVPALGAALAALLLAAVPLRASMISLQLNGTINSSNNPLFPVGQGFTISFVYESTSSPQFIANQQAFYVNPFSTVTLTSGAYSSTVNGSFGQIDLYNNLANTDGIQFQFARDPNTYQFTNPKPNGVAFAPTATGAAINNIFINLASSNTNLYNTFNLPTSYNFADYDSTRNFGVELSNSSFGGGFTSLTSGVVPEPGALSLAALGGGALVAAAAWRGSRRRVVND